MTSRVMKIDNAGLARYIVLGGKVNVPSSEEVNMVNKNLIFSLNKSGLINKSIELSSKCYLFTRVGTSSFYWMTTTFQAAKLDRTVKRSPIFEQLGETDGPRGEWRGGQCHSMGIHLRISFRTGS